MITNIFAVIGAISVCSVFLMIIRAVYLRFTIGLWPSELNQHLRDIEFRSIENAHKVYTARIERDLQSALKSKIVETEYLRKRITDLESDIAHLRQGKDNAETTFLTFLTTLKD